MEKNSIEFLKECDKAYYNTGGILISDEEYDLLKESLKNQFPTDSYFQLVGATPDGDFELPFVLGSLNKKKPDGSLVKWITDNQYESLSCSAKIDGLSLYVKFEKGKVVRASTRGNGYIGKDVTTKIQKICGDLLEPVDIECRCEAVMTTKKALELGYKNARNAVAGIINSDDGKNIEHVDLIFYTVLRGAAITLYNDHFLFLSYLGLNVPEHFNRLAKDDIEEDLKEKYLEMKGRYGYEIDGLVVANYYDPSVGEDYYPGNVCAFKVNAPAVNTKVIDIEWNVGRSGKITPVVIIEPVTIGGATINRVTGFNAKFIYDQKIHPDAGIAIQRSGDVIPYITRCFDNDLKLVNIPTRCPSCGEALKESATNVDLICNNVDCPEKVLLYIENFLLSHDCEEVTYTTLKNLGVKSIYDLYNYSIGEIAQIPGFGISKATKFIIELQKTLNTTPDRLLKSFGIPGIGDTLSKVLLNKFCFEELFYLTSKDLQEIDGVGPILATNIVDGLMQYKDFYEFLCTQGLKFKDKDSEKLKGLVFALTGKSDIGRNELTKMIENNGGLVKSVSKTTSYLVTDDPNSTSGKTKKAKEYGVKIISYKNLMGMMNND